MIRRSFWGVLLKNAAQNTLHGVFLRLQLYCHNLFKVECSLQNYKKAQHFLSMKPKYNSCIVSHFIKCTHIIVNQIVRL